MAKTESLSMTQHVVFEECYTCGIPIAMTEGQKRAYDDDGMAVKCVLGHGTVRRRSEVQRLKEELAQAQDRISTLETEAVNGRGLLQAEAKKRTKLETRIRNGVCPIASAPSRTSSGTSTANTPDRS